MHNIGCRTGDQPQFYQNEDDFEVAAALDFGFIDLAGDFNWIAYLNWDALMYFQAGSAPIGDRVE